MTKELDNHKYCEKALNLKKDIEGNFLELAEYLYIIKEGALFAPQWSTFLEFCWEMKISENMANKLIQIHKTFVLGYGFTSDELTTVGGWAVLQEILPLSDSKVKARHWLNEASHLTQGDLRKTIKESKTGVEMSSCGHNNTRLVEVCNDCGDRHEVYVNKKGEIISLNEEKKEDGKTKD